MSSEDEIRLQERERINNFAAFMAARDQEMEWETEHDDEEEDGNDLDFEPAQDEDEEEEDDDDGDEYEDEEEDAFHDAEDQLQHEIIIETEEDQSQEGEEQNDTARTERGTQAMFLSRNQILRLLGHASFSRIFANQGDLTDDDDGNWNTRSRRRQSREGPPPLEKVPSEAGQQLMASGVFGCNDRTETNVKRRKKLAYRLMQRELGLGSFGRQKSQNKLIAQDLIPSTAVDKIIHYDDRCYSGQFSDDGNFFFSCAQDFKVRMYDTSNPYDWKYYKTVDYPYGQWTITDASLSPDNKYLAYSSIRQVVCLAATDPNDDSEPFMLDFSKLDHGQTESRQRRRWGGYTHFGIWSIRFSGDGREIVAGTGDYSVYVYDIERRKSILRIQGHEDDVNAVCFGDKNSPHILYSGSDDTTLKVWDRRSMGDGRPAAVFLGHTEGLTYVDSKGDGRYVLSNGKDQTMKLWDLRKVVATEKYERLDLSDCTTGFDYRQESFNLNRWTPHPHDCSVVTFRGHSVLRTLIRCHFSPPGSTDSRYVYTGSSAGSVHIYNMDATPAGQINVHEATQGTRPRDPHLMSQVYDYSGRGSSWTTCVRDCSWHPTAPMIAATSWNGYGSAQGTCSVHSWNDGRDEDEGEPKMGLRVDAKLNRNSYFDQTSNEPPGYRTRARRRVADDSDDDDD